MGKRWDETIGLYVEDDDGIRHVDWEVVAQEGDEVEAALDFHTRIRADWEQAYQRKQSLMDDDRRFADIQRQVQETEAQAKRLRQRLMERTVRHCFWLVLAIGAIYLWMRDLTGQTPPTLLFALSILLTVAGSSVLDGMAVLWRTRKGEK